MVRWVAPVLLSTELLYVRRSRAVRPNPLERISARSAPLERINGRSTAGDAPVLAGPAKTDPFQSPKTDPYSNSFSDVR